MTELTIARSGAALDATLEELARDAASLRDAVARLEIENAPDRAEVLDDAQRLDDRAAVEAQGQRARDDNIALTRGLVRVTTQAALLLAKFTDVASTQLPHVAASVDSAANGLRRRTPWIVLGVGIAAAIVAVSAFTLVQARENARQMELQQQALAKAIGESAAAQESAVRALEARMDARLREAALVAAVKAAAAPAQTPPPTATEPIPRAPAKPAPAAHSAKRKSTR
jgi:hypothetical protein